MSEDADFLHQGHHNESASLLLGNAGSMWSAVAGAMAAARFWGRNSLILRIAQVLRRGIFGGLKYH
jgi:hypothetical protein